MRTNEQPERHVSFFSSFLRASFWFFVLLERKIFGPFLKWEFSLGFVWVFLSPLLGTFGGLLEFGVSVGGLLEVRLWVRLRSTGNYLTTCSFVQKLYFWFFSYLSILDPLKSVHFKKTVTRISFLSKLWYFQYKSKQ